MKKSATYVMLVCALIGMAIASYDCYMIYAGQLLWCPPPIDGCNTVAYSPDGRIWGVPIGCFGLCFYAVMFVLAALLAFGPSTARLAPDCACLHSARRLRLDRLHVPGPRVHPRLLHLLPHIRNQYRSAAGIGNRVLQGGGKSRRAGRRLKESCNECALKTGAPMRSVRKAIQAAIRYRP